ncbi:MAG: NACHT domain-containing protein, partial [Cyanobacteria bacterium P01_E01_bin.42]
MSRRILQIARKILLFLIPLNTKANSPSPTSLQHQEIENSTVTGGIQELKGDNNRTIQGEKNTIIQGSNNILLQIQNSVVDRSSEDKQKNVRSRSQQILIDKVKEEINVRLYHSLHNHIYILLEKDEDPTQVCPSYSMDIKVGMKEASPLPRGTKIEEIYDRDDISGKLLILGPPGSGKTTVLLHLAQTLVQRAEDDDKKLIPILFNLSSWQPKSSIFEWMIEQFIFKYKVRKDIAEKWLEDRKILPLLDGLDELKSEYQESCINKINEFLCYDKSPTSLVVCSRTKEYNIYQKHLNLNSSIILLYLDHEQIESYLEQIKSIELWETIQSDKELLDLSKIPLFLNIIVIAYKKISTKKWKELTSSEERKK